MMPINPNRPYYPALDGLRGLAILLVVGFHNFDFIRYFSFGWLGVDLFFVLSGFLITEILLATVNGPHYLRNFYGRRILRIFPLYYLLLFICFLILPAFGLFKEQLVYFTSHQLWFWFYLQNWLYIVHPLKDSTLLIHLWSLAVEEQFYIVWPLLILWIKKPVVLLRCISTVLILIVLARILLWFFHFTNISNFNAYIFTRIDGICVGAILAIVKSLQYDFIRRYTAHIVLSLSGLNFLFYFLNSTHTFSFPYFAFVGYTTFAIMFALLVYEAITGQNKIIQMIFGKGPLKFLGKVSYGFYIFFWPVYYLLTPLLENHLQHWLGWNGNTLRFSSAIITTTLGLLISILSFYYFERPFLKIKAHFS
jgi:peptidoglycan/LPS O-acetylase OafA/YrhL